MPPRVKVCKKCGKTFEAKSGYQKVCYLCSDAHQRNLKKLQPRPCLWCHREISGEYKIISANQFCGRKATCALSYNIIERRIWGSCYSYEKKQQLLAELKEKGQDFKFPEMPNNGLTNQKEAKKE